MSVLRLFPGPSVGTCRNLPAPLLKPRGSTMGVHAVVCGMKLADPGITTEHRGLTAKSWLADIFTTAAVSGRSAALDVCVASTIAAAVTQTLQYAADIASSRNGQHQSAKSLHWRHEIQIALLQRRAAMARAVLPNPAARAEWLFAGIIDRALHHWGHVGARP